MNFIFQIVFIDKLDTNELNRKATTGLQVLKDSITIVDFKHYPLTEGELANYSIKATPLYSIAANATIQLIFPSEFGWDLGSQVAAYSPELQINGSILNVTIHERTLNITNITAFDRKKQTSFLLIIANVYNPVYTATNLQGQIDMYILDTPYNISMYK